MKTSLLLLGLATAGLLWPSALSAYQDPPGDKKPTVIVRDGQFVVRFEGFHFFSEPSEGNAFEVVFSAEGKLITPRREIDFDFEADYRPGAPPKKYPPTVWFKPQNAEDPHSGLLKPGEEIKVAPIQQHQAFWVENPYDEEKRTETALPLAPMGQHLSAEKVSGRGDQIAIVWADNEEFHADEVSLHFSLVSKVESKKRPHRPSWNSGSPRCIPDSQRTSLGPGTMVDCLA